MNSSHATTSNTGARAAIGLLLATAGLAISAPAHAFYVSMGANVGACCAYEGSYAGASAQLTTNGDPNYGTGNTVDYSGTYGTYYQSTRNTTNLTHAKVGADITAWAGQSAYAMGASSLINGHVNALAGAPGSTTGAQAFGKFETDFTVTNSSASDVLLPISWKVEGNPFMGTLAWTGVHSFLEFDVYAQRSYSTGILDYKVDYVNQSLVVSAQNGTNYFNDHFLATSLGGASWLLSDVVDIAPGQSSGSITGFLGLDCRFGSICDYSHTGALTMGSDPAVNFKFDAPGFLSSNAVPEPAAWATMLVGLGFAGASLRQRHCRNQGKLLFRS